MFRSSKRSPLLNWAGKKPTKADREIAKNYLTEQELTRLNKRVKLLFAAADVASEDGRTLTLLEWNGLVQTELGGPQIVSLPADQCGPGASRG